MQFVKKDKDIIGILSSDSYQGLVLATPTKSVKRVRGVNYLNYPKASSKDLLRLWPHRTYSKNRTKELTESFLKDELNERGFFLSYRNESGKWTKVYGRTYPFRDLTRFDTFILPEEFDELDVALCGGSFKLYAKTGKVKSNLCLPDEEGKIGLGEEFEISEDTQVVYYTKRK